MADTSVALPVEGEEVFAEGSGGGGGGGGGRRGGGPAIKFTPSKTGRGRNLSFRGAKKLTAGKRAAKKVVRRVPAKTVARKVPARKAVRKRR